MPSAAAENELECQATSTAQQGIEEFFVDASGARMYVLHAGAGRPLLMLHGLVGSSANWRACLGALAPIASVYAIDQINMGKSQRIAGLDAGLEATADRVAAAMTALGLNTADIVGSSHGGAVALMLAARHPERVRSLILFAPASPFSHCGDYLVHAYTRPLGRLAARLGPYLPARLQRWALGRMYGDPARITDACLHRYTDGLRVPGTMQHILAIVDCWFADMAKLESALPGAAQVPALLVWGDRDRAVDPASAALLRGILQRSELRIMPGVGHIPYEEMPDESSLILLDWLSRAAQTCPAATAESQPACG